MPYSVKGKCVYKKDTGAKVGCTKGDVDKYLAALHANVDEENTASKELNPSNMNESTKTLIQRLIREKLQ